MALQAWQVLQGWDIRRVRSLANLLSAELVPGSQVDSKDCVAVRSSAWSVCWQPATVPRWAVRAVRAMQQQSLGADPRGLNMHVLGHEGSRSR